jgi:O-antigen/teichoic acid export membrane protein
VNVATVAAETRRLALHAVTYLIPNVLVRGITLLLTPLYTRMMGPAEFAVVALANTLITALGIVLGFALYACVTRVYVECGSEEERRRFFGTLLSFNLLIPPLLIGILYAVGAAGFLNVVATLPFSPHLQIVLGTALASVYLPLPTSVYMAREEPAKVAALNAFSALSQVALTLLFVVVFREAALGVLYAGLLSGGMTAIVSVLLMLRVSRLTIDRVFLWQALAYGVPLVPHLLSNWALSLSDRLILERYISHADLGRYSLAYLFNFAVTLFANSVTAALGPIAFRCLRSDRLAREVPLLGTYALGAIVLVGLAASLVAPEAMHVLAPAGYQAATSFVPWVVLGATFQGVYFIWSLGTGFSMKTKGVPFVTFASAALNVGLNLVFVPRFGAMSAAITTAVCYAVAAALHGALAHYLFPIAWEYRRWVLLFLNAGVCYWIAVASAPHAIVAGLLVKAAILSIVFPGLLFASGFLTVSERQRVRTLVRRRTASESDRA